MIELSNYITEYYSSDLLKDEKDWVKISSKEYVTYISDKPELYEMIPYKELGLSKPNSILITIKREGPRWVSYIKWTGSDKKIYFCNGWKLGEYTIDDLKIKIHEIVDHLSKSQNARKLFKDVTISLINNYELFGYKNPIDYAMSYDGTASDLEDLLNR